MKMARSSIVGYQDYDRLKKVSIFIKSRGSMTIKKYKVIENYSTTEGTLYQGEVLKEDNNNTLEDHKRLKDSMGKVWFVPHKYIVRI